MPNRNNYWTQQRPDGQRESKRGGARRATKVTDTQAESQGERRGGIPKRPRWENP